MRESPSGFDAELLEERMQASDPYLNYCLWPYAPPAAGIGKLRPSVLLFRAINEMPHCEWLVRTIRAIQRGISDFRSVYGIKQIDGKWAIEIYLYDYGRENRSLSVERFETACCGQLSFTPRIDPAIPYFMFSFDLTELTARNSGVIPVVHVYIGNPGSDVSSGIAYEFTESSKQLENFYFFFDAHRHQREIVDKLECSVYGTRSGHGIEQVYRPELSQCQTICLANKRTCDTVYYSGIHVDQLLFFLKWQQYPESFVSFVIDRRDLLDHLRYDVGIDYRTTNDSVEIVKHGIYGIF